MPGKLGKTTEQRLAILRNQASQLLWNGRLETTAARAKELRPYVEKLITKAVNSYDDVVEYEVVAKDKKGKEIKTTAIKDGPKRLAARRAIMAKTYDLQEIKAFNEKKSDFKKRTAKVQHPLMEKLFNELPPKYAQRKAEIGHGGGRLSPHLPSRPASWRRCRSCRDRVGLIRSILRSTKGAVICSSFFICFWM